MQSVSFVAIIPLIVMILGYGQRGVAQTLQIDEQQTQHLTLINNQTTECVNIGRCFFDWIWGTCRVELHINHSDRKCKMIFGEVTNPSIVTTLAIYGELAELPDAINKFEKLTKFDLASVQLEKMERAKLAPFGRIQILDLSRNLLSELAADTFDDLKDLSRLELSSNNLKTIHRNVFQQLHNLEYINLDKNQLEILPDGLFRNNQKLTEISLSLNNINVLHPDVFKDLRNLKKLDLVYNQLEVLPNGIFRDNQNLENIWLAGNKIRKIECNFYNLPSLIHLNLNSNVCIDEWCEVKSFCGTTSMGEMHTMLWSKCPNES